MKEKIIIALDFEGKDKVRKICSLLQDKVKIYKVGLKLFLSEGVEVIKLIQDFGCDVFLDLKFFDIPYQIGLAVEEVIKMKVKMFTLHTLGGFEMMRQAVEVLEEKSQKFGLPRPMALGVTVLTSLEKSDIPFNQEVREVCLKLTETALRAGLDGVVTSPLETSILRENFGNDFIIINPGIRLPSLPPDDQKRTLTPLEAVKAGASYLVIGRPIIQAPDPDKVVNEILKEVERVNGEQ